MKVFFLFILYVWSGRVPWHPQMAGRHCNTFFSSFVLFHQERTQDQNTPVEIKPPGKMAAAVLLYF